MLQTSLIYLAVTHGKKRLEITGDFGLYCQFMRASLPNLANFPGATIFNPAPTENQETTLPKKGQRA